MAINFPVDEWIRLDGGSDSGTELSWTGFSVQTLNTNVIDDDEDGNADVGVDGWISLGMNYTGYTVNVGGTEFPVFDSGGIFVIPYNTAVDDIGGTFPAGAGSTTTTNAEAPIPYCFMGGTKISTPAGERAVEALAIGDTIQAADGREVQVKWVGRQRVQPTDLILSGNRLAPVCISEGALGNHSDLYVSADHGMIVGGHVINASALVNGDTVRFAHASELPTEFTYYHIETDAHDVILANGAPSETFMDAAGRAAFDNHAEYLELYGAERIIPEMAIPRIASARLVPQEIKARLAPGHTVAKAGKAA